MSFKVSLYRYLQSHGVTLCYRRPARDNHEMNRGHTMFTYEIYARDSIRNEAYQSVIRKCVKNRTVLEVGTGPYALLATMCIDAGSRMVYAIEENEMALCAATRKVIRERNETRIQLVRGFSAEVQLKHRCDVLLHEIVGAIGSAEGMALIANDARKRLLTSNPIYIPHSCTTFMSPVSPLRMSMRDRLITAASGGRASPGDRGLYKVINFPGANIVAEPQCFERIVFGDEIPLMGTGRVRFVLQSDALFDGLLFHIELYVDPQTVVNSLTQRTNWPTTYVKLYQRPIALSRGDAIDVHFQRDLSTTDPKYVVNVNAHHQATRTTHSTEFAWSGN